MQTLLVASQKGGVGKTTTSINLAAATAMTGTRVLLLDADPLSSISAMLGLSLHPQRHHLQQSGLDLPGVLTCNVLPCLDVLSPYDESGCSDERLDQLLGLLAQPAFRACYGCLVVNTQPFLGSNAQRLLAICDRYLLVMRRADGPPHLPGVSGAAAAHPADGTDPAGRHPAHPPRGRTPRQPLGTRAARPLRIAHAAADRAP